MLGCRSKKRCYQGISFVKRRFFPLRKGYICIIEYQTHSKSLRKGYICIHRVSDTLKMKIVPKIFLRLPKLGAKSLPMISCKHFDSPKSHRASRVELPIPVGQLSTAKLLDN